MRFGPKVLILLALSLILGIFSLRFMTTFHDLRETPTDFWTTDQFADCGLVLTGGPQRVREGLDLLARQQIRKLIISGVNPSAGFTEIFPIHPFHSEVREEDVILERKSLTTFGNVQQSVPIIEALKCRDVILITSSIHMFRALRTLRSELPAPISVIPRSVSVGGEKPGVIESLVETSKVLFYSAWAF